MAPVKVNNNPETGATNPGLISNFAEKYVPRVENIASTQYSQNSRLFDLTYHKFTAKQQKRVFPCW